MSPIIKNTLVFGGLIALAAFGYYLYSSHNLGGIAVENSNVGGNQASAEAQEFLNKLNMIDRINISSDLFNDPRFQSLEDFTQPVTAVTVGRENPFAPAQIE